MNELDRELASTKKSLSSFVVKAKLKEQSINHIKGNIKKVERETGIIRNEASAASQVLMGRGRGITTGVRIWRARRMSMS